MSPFGKNINRLTRKNRQCMVDFIVKTSKQKAIYQHPINHFKLKKEIQNSIMKTLSLSNFNLLK